jgi:hypothetical protein
VQNAIQAFIPSSVSVTVHGPVRGTSDVQVSLTSTRHLLLEEMQTYNPMWRDPKLMLRAGKPVATVHGPGGSKEQKTLTVSCLMNECSQNSLATCEYNMCPTHCIAVHCACRRVCSPPHVSPSAIDRLFSGVATECHIPPLQTCVTPTESSAMQDLRYAAVLQMKMSLISLWHLADQELMFLPSMNSSGALEVSLSHFA